MKRILFLLATFCLPLSIFANNWLATIGATANILAPKYIEVGGMIDAELQLEVTDILYKSGTTQYNHAITIHLSGAEFVDEGGKLFSEEQFESLIILNRLTHGEDMFVDIIDYDKTSFSFILGGGILLPDDILAIQLSGQASRKVGDRLLVSVESDVMHIDDTAIAELAEKGFFLSFGDTYTLVPNERISLGSNGLKISPVVSGAYQKGTEFEISVSNGFALSADGQIRAKDDNNVVTFGRIHNGKIFIEAPSDKPFSISNIILEATSAKVGDVAEITAYAQGMVVSTQSNTTQPQQAEEGSRPTIDSDNFNPTDKTEEDDMVVENETDIVDDMVVENETAEKVAFTKRVHIPIGVSEVVVNGTPIYIDTPAYINDTNYTMLPIRAITEVFGDAISLHWDNHTKTITMTIFEKDEIIISAGKTTYIQNGKLKSLVSPLEIVNGRAFLSVRDLSQLLYISDVVWNEDLKIVILNGTN